MSRDFRKRLAQLRTELKERIINQGGFDEVAQRIGCTREALSNLVRDKRPSLEMAKALQDVVGIQMERWADQYRLKKRGAA